MNTNTELPKNAKLLTVEEAKELVNNNYRYYVNGDGLVKIQYSISPQPLHGTEFLVVGSEEGKRTYSPTSKKEPRTQEAGGMKYGPIETILATPAMKEELQQKGRIEVLCSEGFQTLRAVKEQTPFWMDGIYVRVIARNERATVVLLEEECVSVPSTGSDVGTKSVHLQ